MTVVLAYIAFHCDADRPVYQAINQLPDPDEVVVLWSMTPTGGIAPKGPARHFVAQKRPDNSFLLDRKP